MVSKSRKIIYFVSVTLILLFIILIAVGTGSIDVSIKDILRGFFLEPKGDVKAAIDMRIPRIIISVFAGASIAVSGVLLQATMRNPLADPGIIGISSGAAFAASIVTVFMPQWYYYIPVIASLGGIIAFFVVYGLSYSNGLSPIRIILVGISVNFIFTGFINVLESMSSGPSEMIQASGLSLVMKTWDDSILLAAYSAIGLIISVTLCKRCDILALEDKTIQSLGINVSKSRMLISAVSVVLASVSTAVIGPICFLGLIGPHIARKLIGHRHFALIPYSALIGATVLLAVDTIGRTIIYPIEISASILMTVVGGPFFILLLRGAKNNYGK